MIISRLIEVMEDRQIGVNELSAKIDIHPINITRIRMGDIKGIRFSTLNKLCRELKCKPGDILDYVEDDSLAIESVSSEV